MVTCSSNIDGGTIPLKFYGLSTDEKPLVTFCGVKITNASKFIEMDTGNYFMYDAQNHKWYEQ